MTAARTLLVSSALAALAACDDIRLSALFNDAAEPDDASSLGSVDAWSSNDAAGACTNTLSSTLTGTYGRLDGTLSAIVPPTATACNPDATHLHLQVAASGGTFDIAVPVSFTDSGNVIGVDEKNATLPGPAWTEGWHDSGILLDYVGTLNARSRDFSLVDENTALTRLNALLTVGARLSVFGHVYPSKDGLNGIFRDNGVSDGAIVVVGATTDHWVLLRKSTQTF
jgi:hypothetical protein